MRIDNNCNSPHFTAMRFEKDTIPLLKRMSIKQLKQVKQWKKEVAYTKNWDLNVSYNKWTDDFYPTYQNKDSYRGIAYHCGGIDAYKLDGKSVRAHSYTNDENVYDVLEFSTRKRAEEAYDVMQGNDFNLSPFERIERYVKSLKLLDESYQYMKENNIKLPDWARWAQ